MVTSVYVRCIKQNNLKMNFDISIMIEIIFFILKKKQLMRFSLNSKQVMNSYLSTLFKILKSAIILNGSYLGMLAMYHYRHQENTHKDMETTTLIKEIQILPCEIMSIWTFKYEETMLTYQIYQS